MLIQKVKKPLLIFVLALFAAGTLAGCATNKDTRQYTHTIGVVFTNNEAFVFNELFVYPTTTDEMGPDFIQNTKNTTKIGSYGVTVEAANYYNVLLRDEYGGVYRFDDLPLENCDEAVIFYDYKDLSITINHRGGGSEVIEGRIVEPGDAPDHPHAPLQQQVSFGFQLQNDTDSDLKLITMREATDQQKGDVELYSKILKKGESANITGKLYEEDEAITEWVMYVETSGNQYAVSTNEFDPWRTEKVTITGKGNKFTFDFVLEEGNGKAATPAASGSSSAATADSSSK